MKKKGSLASLAIIKQQANMWVRLPAQNVLHKPMLKMQLHGFYNGLVSKIAPKNVEDKNFVFTLSISKIEQKKNNSHSQFPLPKAFTTNKNVLLQTCVIVGQNIVAILISLKTSSIGVDGRGLDFWLRVGACSVAGIGGDFGRVVPFLIVLCLLRLSCPFQSREEAQHYFLPINRATLVYIKLAEEKKREKR
jgi:hypothetical protein